MEDRVILDRTRNRIWPGWLACFAAAFALYAATANRGAQWQDSGYFILRAVTGESLNPLGLALTHPLHYWLSRFALRLDLTEPAFAVTLVSSLAAAVAVANLFGCVVTLTGNRMAALLVAASLALANTFWHLATIAEVYTLTAALLTAECWCLILFVKSTFDCQAASSATIAQSLPRTKTRRWAFLGMFFCNGMSLANHNLALLTVPVLAVAGVWAWKRGHVPMRFLAIGLSLWILGSSPYTVLAASEALRSGDWTGTLHSALFGRAFGGKVLSASISWRSMLIAAGFVFLSFPNLFLPSAIYGLKAVWRSSDDSWPYRLLFLGLAIHGLFAFRYPVPDQHYFFIPTYIMLSLFAGVGFARWTTRPPASNVAPPQHSPMSFKKSVIVIASLLIVATPVVYAVAPALLRRFDALEFFKRNKPYRDDYAYLFHPWSVSEQSADRMSREAVELAGESGFIIVEDGMAEYAVRYRAHRTARGNIAVVAELAPRDFEEAAGAGRRIVLVPRDADHPVTHPLTGTWRREGDLYVLDPG